MGDSRAIEVPVDVLREVRARWPELAEPWLTTVGTELRELCDRYDATPIRVMHARFGLVIKAETPTGTLILRSSPDPEGSNQGIVSTALASLGVSPRVHELITTEHGTWTVMDCVTPGTPLGDQDSPPKLEHVVTMLRPLAGQPAPASDLPDLIEWLHHRLTDDGLQDLPAHKTVAPRKERIDALAVLDSLSHDYTPSLCHGDTSPWNVLTSTDNRLYLIDPRGIAGELPYDVAILALKPAARIPLNVSTRTLAEALSLSVERVRAWITVALAARV